MRWRPRLISEDTDTRVTRYSVQLLDNEPTMVFEVQFLLTPDEIRRAERESDMPPLEPPVRYPTAAALVSAINDDKYPPGIDFDDIVRYIERAGLQHLVVPRTYHEAGYSGGIERSEANQILAAVFHRTRERVFTQTGDDALALKTAQKVMASAKRPEFWGGDARAAKGQPGSPKYRATVIPALVKHFMNISRGPAIEVVKRYFANFPSDWQTAIFGKNGKKLNYVDMEGASHFKSQPQKAPVDKRTESVSKKMEQLYNDIESALMQTPKPEAKPEDTRRWLTLYSMVTVPFGDDTKGFRGKFVAQFKRAVAARKITQIGEQDGRPIYRWDTGIPGFNEWVRKMDEIGKDWATTWLKLILKSSSVTLADKGNDLADSEIIFHRKQAPKAAAATAEQPPQFVPPPTETPQAPAVTPDAAAAPAQQPTQQFVMPPTESVIKRLAAQL